MRRPRRRVAAATLVGGLALGLVLAFTRWDGPFPWYKVGTVGEWMSAIATAGAVTFAWYQLNSERKLTREAIEVAESSLQLERDRWRAERRSVMVAFAQHPKTGYVMLYVRNDGASPALDIRVRIGDSDGRLPDGVRLASDADLLNVERMSERSEVKVAILLVLANVPVLARVNVAIEWRDSVTLETDIAATEVALR